MAVSQFIYYSSSDAGGPGTISGTAGSLLTVLDACLVNGYTGHAAAGWTKPFANSGNVGCYTQGAGALLSLLINDNGPNATSTYREAWMTGWESIATIAAPVGTGTGQFPLPTQCLTTGHTVIRKSATADSTARFWQMWADASTFYLFISNGDVAAPYYSPVMFGDMFALALTADAYRCMLIGGATENSTGIIGGGSLPTVGNSFDCMLVQANTNPMTFSLGGHFAARSWGGVGGSVTLGKTFDAAKSAANGYYANMTGFIQSANGPDNSLYLSPVYIVEPSGAALRGRLRGIYQICHPPANFTDGQTFSGSNDYAGKSFTVVKILPNGGFVAVETSATVETN